jgi:hypothetical protein
MNPETQNPYDWEDGSTEASADFFSFVCVAFVLILFGYRVKPNFLVTDRALEFAKSSGTYPYASPRYTVPQGRTS